MGAVVTLVESNGAGEALTSDPANLNFGTVDSAALDPAANPLVGGAADYSFEKWLRLQVVSLGDISQIDNVKLWMSDGGGGLADGESVKTNVRSTTDYASQPYSQPVDSESSIATLDMPTAEPAGANLGIGGSLTGVLSAPGYSDYAVIQLQISGSTPSGSLSQKTFTLQWDEQ